MMFDHGESKLNLRKILLFWYPLALTWMMMSFEGPFIAAVIARLPVPKFNLAAYGVAFSFALIMEAPIIMIMSASTALVKNKNSYLKLKRFTFTLNTIITTIMIIGLLPPVFYFITETLINLPHNLAHLTHITSIILLPWPAAIGYRRFFQGILIRSNLTRRVAYGTILRLSTMALTSLLLALTTKLPGAYIGGAALSTGVTFEALIIRLMTNSSIKKLTKPIDSNNDDCVLTYKFIIYFYYPLAFTSMLALGVQPLVTFFLGQSRLPIESLAVLPVVNALVFMFRCFGLSFQEVGIALMGSKGEGYQCLKKFALILGVSTVVGLALITFTPLSFLWFNKVSGLNIELTMLAITPSQILTLIPGLTVLLSFQRAILVYSRKTSPITWATFIEVSGIVFVLFISIKYMNAIGVIAAASSFLIGRLGANTFLYSHAKNAVKKITKTVAAI